MKQNSNFLFYGTLRDPDIQRLIAGPDLAKKFWRSEVLTGHALVFVAGTAYPGLRADAKASFIGDLYVNLSHQEQTAIVAYEDADYHLSEWRIKGIAFQVFLPTPQLELSDTPWSLQDFQIFLKSSYLTSLK